MLPLMTHHLVRFGLVGHVGRFSSVEPIRFERGTGVICRTRRGLEQGRVLTMATANELEDSPDGTLLRAMTPQDELLAERLERHRHRAYEACQRLLIERSIPAVLMDVEHLFDGSSLYFYFLGSVTPEVETLTDELAKTYDANVQFRQFAETLAEGCGPDCGTEEVEGCGTSCSTCSIAGKCGSTKR